MAKNSKPTGEKCSLKWNAISLDMINKINKERRCSTNATAYDPATRTIGKEPRRTPNKNRTGHKTARTQVEIRIYLLYPILVTF
jgi:hypothetical protein